MALTNYPYSISADFPNDKVALDLLTLQIQSSSIVTALGHIDTSGDDCNIWFKDPLSGGDQITLDGLVAAHSGDYLNGITVTGSLAALNSTLLIVPSESGNIGVQITGTWVGTIVIEATINSSDWFVIDMLPFGDLAAIQSTATNGQWRVVSSGVTQVRAKMSAYTSGSAGVTLAATESPAIVRSVGSSSSFISAYNSTSNTTRTSILATTYAEQLTNAQRSIASSSASDTSAGTGARTVLITYYDQTMAGPFTETVTLNGTANVNTVASNICFIESIRVVTAGSGGNNAGTLTLFISTAGGGGTLAQVAVNDNQTNWAQHYVAKDKTMLLNQVVFGNQGASAGNITILKTTPTVSNSTDFVIAPQIRAQPGVTQALDFKSPLRITGPARVLLFVKQDSASGTNNWFAGFAYQEM
jgi:hypothetical protein